MPAPLNRPWLVVIIVAGLGALALLATLLWPTPQKPVITEAPDPEHIACINAETADAWLNTRIQARKDWKQNHRYAWFTAKRMAMEPWENYQAVVAAKDKTLAPAIRVMARTEGCNQRELNALMVRYVKWHKQMLMALDAMAEAYPEN